jgi:hypothetical protein
MDFTWVDKIQTFKVERREIPRPNGKSYYLNSSTLIGVLHTTEGTTVEGACDTLNEKFSAPHFIAGEGKIVQCRPLNAQGSALRSGMGNTANVHGSDSDRNGREIEREALVTQSRNAGRAEIDSDIEN